MYLFPLYKKNPLLFHILFWVGYFMVAFSIFIAFFKADQAIVRVLSNGVVHAFIIYFNIFWLMPKFFLKGRFVLHYLLILLLLAGTTVLKVYIDYWLQSPISVIPIELGSITHYGTKVLSGIVIISLSSSVKLMEDHLEHMELERELERYKLEAELKFLKAQVSPHFLFNTLNNIYTLAYTGAKETAPMILKLSEMMRYMLYESNEQLVPLSQEVNYMENYISLQQLKQSEAQNITLEVNGPVGQWKIPPMLLIPFLENGFKHGNVNNTTDGWLHTSIVVDEGRLLFEVRNSVSQGAEQKDKVGGIGLENVNKRLQMIYPGRHEMSIEEPEGEYLVVLKISAK